MPPMTSSSESYLYFQSVFNTAMEAYENKTKKKLLTHPLATQLQSCNSPAAVLSMLQELIQQFDQRHRSDERLRSWLNPTVNVLFSFSAVISEGVGLIFSPAQVIFASIGILLLAAKDLDSSHDTLIDLFESIETFFRRLESYTEVPPSSAMTDTIVKIMIEVLSILAIATNEVKQRRPKKYLRKLIGRNDIEGALKRLDKLTQEEARMATAEVLKVTHSIDDKVKVLIEDGREATEVIQQTTNETKEIIQRTASETVAITHQMAGNLNDVTRSQLLENFQKWLRPPDASMNHNIAYKGHYKGTAAWFFQDDIFSQWKSSPSLLWIHGKPGSGKSVLWFVIPALVIHSDSIMAQLRNN
ncbi:hypothetical protein F5888DRAFT_1698521 [Russula emetica]|nr:hypothetical protein F5888DRAFT_1698521 [Russula emetica]